jgi:hypothetical protein
MAARGTCQENSQGQASQKRGGLPNGSLRVFPVKSGEDEVSPKVAQHARDIAKENSAPIGGKL